MRGQRGSARSIEKLLGEVRAASGVGLAGFPVEWYLLNDGEDGQIGYADYEVSNECRQPESTDDEVASIRSWGRGRRRGS